MRKIYAISMVKNEADIIESFVRYHLNIVDGMVILDNRSTDNTLRILESLVSEGIPLVLIQDESMDYMQAEKMTELLYHTFEAYDPDIIIPLDADEFVISSRDSQLPRQILERLDLRTLHFLRSITYVPNEADNEKELFIPKRIIHSSASHTFKVMITKELAYKYFPAISRGNHNLHFSSLEDEQHIVKEYSQEVSLAHYSVRSIEQAKSKYFLGWLAHLARANKARGEGAHWERLFHLLKETPDLSLSRLVGNKSGMTRKPIDVSYCKSIEMKYTKANEVNVMKNLIHYCEALARNYAKLKRK